MTDIIEKYLHNPDCMCICCIRIRKIGKKINDTLYHENKRLENVSNSLIEEFRSDIRYWLNQKDRNKIEIDYILKDIDSKWEGKLK